MSIKTAAVLTRSALTGKFFDIVFPVRCALCGQWVRYPRRGLLCAECLQALQAREEPEAICSSCGREIHPALENPCPGCRIEAPPFAACRSAFPYQAPLDKLIHSVKFGRQRVLCRDFGYLLDRRLPATDNDWLVTWVPLSLRRRLGRGFDQAREIATAFAARRNLEVQPLLRRVRHTRPQARMGAFARRCNLKDAFQVRHGAMLSGKRILLIDDVVTTGATVSACSCALLQAGASEVQVYSVAHG